MKEFNHILNSIYNGQTPPRVDTIDGMRHYIIGEEKFPSITSKCKRFTPRSSTTFISSDNLVKFAESNDGEIILFIYFPIHKS